jgi:uncharacterized protein YdbL (DUF1318 family)
MTAPQAAARVGALVALLALFTLVGALVALLALEACVTVKPVILDRKTQLENQILGTFQRLEDDLVLASSVRGERAETGLSPLAREALDAMLTREYHRDDLDALKQKHVVGEAKTGYLAILAPPRNQAEAAKVRALTEEENRCRKLILQRAIALGRGLSEKDLPELERVFYRLNLKTARPGDRVQSESGGWQIVTGESAGGSTPGGSAPGGSAPAAGKQGKR